MRSLLSSVLIALFLFATGLAHGQDAKPRLSGQAKLDSMVAALPSAYDDEKKVDLLGAIAYGYCMVEPAKGLIYANQEMTLAQQLQYKKGIADANEKIGVNYNIMSDYPKALEFLLKALKQYEEIQDKKRIAGTMGNIGNIYINQENYDKALEYYFKVLNMFQELKDTADIAITTGNIGNVYANQGNLDKALEYNNKALIICEAIGDKRGIASNVKNIGDVYETQRNYSKAIEYDQKALAMFTELGNRRSVAVCLGNLGECFLTIARDTIAVKSDALIPVGKAAQLARSIEYSKQAIAMCIELGTLDDLQKFSQNLSDAQMMVGDYKGALENYKQFITYRDSVFGHENQVKMLELETKRDVDVTNKQIELNKLTVSKRHNERIFYITGIVLLLAFVAIVMRSYISQRKTNKQLSSEKKRSDDLLLNILPVDVAEELKEKGRSMARYFDNVTVLFTDFVDFTRAGELMSPQQLVDELDTCFRAFDAVMTKYQIEKIKTVGDAYLAAAGVPRADKHHAENMVKAAIEIRDFMIERKKKMRDETFDVRIGVHTGYVVAGIVGATKFAYDIWGDTVNTAARLEQSSANGKINISQTTYDLVKDKFTCTYRGNIEAKNKGELSMYFVES